MSDRLEEIKKRNEDFMLEFKEVISQKDLDWLISELEKSRAEVKRLKALLSFHGKYF